MVSNEILRNPNISLRDKGLYAHLATYTDGQNECTVSISRIATECGIDQSTVRRSLERLKKEKIIERVRRGHNMSFITKLLK